MIKVKRLPSWAVGSVFYKSNLESGDVESGFYVPEKYVMDTQIGFGRENFDDFLLLFEASNFYGLYRYPIEIYVYSLLFREDVLDYFTKNYNSYGEIFIKDLLYCNSILKYKSEILEYADFHRMESGMLTLLRETQEIDIDCMIEEITIYPKKHGIFETLNLNSFYLTIKLNGKVIYNTDVFGFIGCHTKGYLTQFIFKYINHSIESDKEFEFIDLQYKNKILSLRNYNIEINDLNKYRILNSFKKMIEETSNKDLFNIDKLNFYFNLKDDINYTPKTFSPTKISNEESENILSNLYNK